MLTISLHTVTTYLMRSNAPLLTLLCVFYQKIYALLIIIIFKNWKHQLKPQAYSADSLCSLCSLCSLWQPIIGSNVDKTTEKMVICFDNSKYVSCLYRIAVSTRPSHGLNKLTQFFPD